MLMTSRKYFYQTQGVVDPEKKRKIIGNQFIYSFDRIAMSLGRLNTLHKALFIG